MESTKQRQHCFSNEADKAGFDIILENLEDVGAIIFYHHSYFEIKQEGRNHFILYVRNNEGLDNTIAYNAVENYLEKKKIEKMCKQASEKYMVSSDDSDWSAIDHESETSDNLVDDIEERMKTLLTSSEKRPTRVVKFRDEEEKIVEEDLEQESEVDKSLLDTSDNVNVTPIEEKVVKVETVVDNDIKENLAKIMKYVESQSQRQAEKERQNRNREGHCKKIEQKCEMIKRELELEKQEALLEEEAEEWEKQIEEANVKNTALVIAKTKMLTEEEMIKIQQELREKQVFRNKKIEGKKDLTKIVNYVEYQIQREAERERLNREEDEQWKKMNAEDSLLDTSDNVNVSPIEEKVVKVETVVDNDIKENISKIVKYVESQIQRQAEKERQNRDREEHCKWIEKKCKMIKKQLEQEKQEALFEKEAEEWDKNVKELNVKYRDFVAAKNKMSEEDKVKRQQELDKEQALLKKKAEDREKQIEEANVKNTALMIAKNKNLTEEEMIKIQQELREKQVFRNKKNEGKKDLSKIVNHVESQIQREAEKERQNREEAERCQKMNEEHKMSEEDKIKRQQEQEKEQAKKIREEWEKRIEEAFPLARLGLSNSSLSSEEANVKYRGSGAAKNSLLDTSVNVNGSPVEEEVVKVETVIDNDIKKDMAKVVKYVENQIQRQAEKERLNKEEAERRKKMNEDYNKRMEEYNKKSEEAKTKRHQKSEERHALRKKESEEWEKKMKEDKEKVRISMEAKKKEEQDHMDWLTTTLNDTKANTEALTKELMELKRNQEYLIQTGIAKIVNYVDNQIEKQMEQDRMKEEERQIKILNLADCIKKESKNWEKQQEIWKEKREYIEKMKAELHENNSESNNVKTPEVNQTSFETLQSFVIKRLEDIQKCEEQEMEAKKRQETDK